MSQTTPQRRRRWFSLSLRGLMLLILVVGGLMGWKARRASLQRRAVARIQYLRGSVKYDWQPRGDFPGTPPVVTEPSGPKWLRRMLGDEYFQEVVEVKLTDLQRSLRPPRIPLPARDLPEDGPEWRAYREEISRKEKEARLKEESRKALEEDELACLDGLDRIETLELRGGPPLKSAGLARLGRLTSLKELTSIHNSMNAEGLKQIAKLSQLEQLSLKVQLSDDSELTVLEQIRALKELSLYDGTQGNRRSVADGPETPAQFTDAWLARLGRIKSLTRLYLDNNSRITDAGLAHLKDLRQLEDLTLDESRSITDAGLAHLSGLTNLKRLNFASAVGITDSGLVSLKPLNHLEWLIFSSTPHLTDAGLAHLVGLQNLQSIELEAASNVTDAGIESLAKLPQLRGLDLNVKSVTDAGLKRLKSFTKLKILRLVGRKNSGEILDEIKTAIPGVMLHADRLEQGADPDQPSTPPVSRSPFDLTLPPVAPRS